MPPLGFLDPVKTRLWPAGPSGLRPWTTASLGVTLPPGLAILGEPDDEARTGRGAVNFEPTTNGIGEVTYENEA